MSDTDTPSILPESRTYFKKFIAAHFDDFLSDMKEFRSSQSNGYGPYYRHSEVTQHMRDIIGNLGEAFGDLSIPGHFPSPKALVQKWEVFFSFLSEKEEELFKNVFDNFQKENTLIPDPVHFLYRNHKKTLDLLSHILSMEEVKPFTSSFQAAFPKPQSFHKFRIGKVIKSKFFYAFLLVSLTSLFLFRSCQSNSSSTTSARSKFIGTHNPAKKGVIIFVHGIFGDADSTWTNTSTGAYFPKLVKDDPAFKDYDIFVYGFHTPKFNRSLGVEEIADRMNNDFATNQLWNYQRIAFVSHSMGGLITRQFLARYANTDSLQYKTKFLFFFATPTNGSDLANWAKIISNNPQLENMTVTEGNGYSNVLSGNWRGNKNLANITSYAAYEKLKTGPAIVVSENSASALTIKPLCPIEANHVDIVKPRDTIDDSYTYFRNNFLKEGMAIFSQSLRDTSPTTKTTANPPERLNGEASDILSKSEREKIEKSKTKAYNSKPCPPWMEGGNCELEMREKFYGNYRGFKYQISGSGDTIYKAAMDLLLSEDESGIRDLCGYLGKVRNGKKYIWKMTLTGPTSLLLKHQEIEGTWGVAEGVFITESGAGHLDQERKHLIFEWKEEAKDRLVYWTMVLRKID